jgi:hypothetical protein
MASGRLRSVRSQVLERIEAAAVEAELRESEALRKLEEAKAAARARELELGLPPGSIEVEVPKGPAPPVAGSKISGILYTEPMCEALADDLVEWLWESPEHYIMVEWLVAKGISNSTLSGPLKGNRVFMAAWEYAMTVQEARLLRRGLECRSDAQVTKLALMARHGYKEQQEVTGEMGVRALPGNVEETDRMIEALQAHRAALAGMVEQARQIESAVVSG